MLHLAQDAAAPFATVDEGHPVACLSQIQRGADAAYACANNECSTYFSFHYIPRLFSKSQIIYLRHADKPTTSVYSSVSKVDRGGGSSKLRPAS